MDITTTTMSWQEERSHPWLAILTLTHAFSVSFSLRVTHSWVQSLAHHVVRHFTYFPIVVQCCAQFHGADNVIPYLDIKWTVRRNKYTSYVKELKSNAEHKSKQVIYVKKFQDQHPTPMDKSMLHVWELLLFTRRIKCFFSCCRWTLCRSSQNVGIVSCLTGHYIAWSMNLCINNWTSSI